MKLRLLGAVYACLFSLGIVTSAKAAVIYAYTGDTFDSIFDDNPPQGAYSNTDFVSVTFTVPELLINLGPSPTPITPTSFSISDGRNTFTSAAPPPRLNFEVITDERAAIAFWQIFASNKPFGFSESNLTLGEQWLNIATFNGIGANDDAGAISERTAVFDGLCETTNLDLGQTMHIVSPNPGVWTVVPIPPALYLFGTGLLGLMGVARRKKG